MPVKSTDLGEDWFLKQLATRPGRAAGVAVRGSMTVRRLAPVAGSYRRAGRPGGRKPGVTRWRAKTLEVCGVEAGQTISLGPYPDARAETVWHPDGALPAVVCSKGEVRGWGLGLIRARLAARGLN